MADGICLWCGGSGTINTNDPDVPSSRVPCRGCGGRGRPETGGSGREGVRGPAYGPPELAPEDVPALGPPSVMAMDDNALGQKFLEASVLENPLTLDEYQRLAARTICDQAKALERAGGPEVGAEDGNFPSLVPIQLMHSLIGIQNEAGELAKLIQGWIYYGKGLSQEALIEEYGDLLWYVAEGLTAICVSMGAVGAGNIAKLRARYPDRYTDEAAANRDLAAEAAALRVGAAVERATVGSIPPKVDLDEDSRHRREDQKVSRQGTAAASAGGKSVEALRAAEARQGVYARQYGRAGETLPEGAARVAEALDFVRKYGGRPAPPVCESCGGSGRRMAEGLRTEACPGCGGSGRPSEPCCDCGEPYPRAELLAGHVFCRACRARGPLGAPPEAPDLPPPLHPAGMEGPPPAPPVLPPGTCRHCRGAGEVNCEWAPGVTSPCPTCGGTGRDVPRMGSCQTCEVRWRSCYFVDPGPCPACGTPYGGRLKEEEGPLVDPRARHPVCPDGHDWQPDVCVPGGRRRCRRCGGLE